MVDGEVKRRVVTVVDGATFRNMYAFGIMIAEKVEFSADAISQARDCIREMRELTAANPVRMKRINVCINVIIRY